MPYSSAVILTGVPTSVLCRVDMTSGTCGMLVARGRSTSLEYFSKCQVMAIRSQLHLCIVQMAFALLTYMSRKGPTWLEALNGSESCPAVFSVSCGLFGRIIDHVRQGREDSAGI